MVCPVIGAFFLLLAGLPLDVNVGVGEEGVGDHGPRVPVLGERIMVGVPLLIVNEHAAAELKLGFFHFNELVVRERV
jgi:hypothetical protein